jgi:acrylyl-CoA reductase (NADPH)
MQMRALMLQQAGDGVSATIDEHVDMARLPEGDVLVAVDCSTLNYKDGLILKGVGRLVRVYPHVPGVDFAGIVLESAHSAFKPGDPVILTGWRVGEMQWGGYATHARVRGDWLVPLPAGLSLRQSMAIGTAGFTAMLALMALQERGLRPDDGPVLVTGAAGGVGSIATVLLARAGFHVTCLTGRADQADYLRHLGASEIVGREGVEGPGKPLESERWAACVDAVGGAPLARILAQLRHGGAVAAIGNAAGNSVPASILPFLLRGVALLGIDSVLCPQPRRQAAWARLVQELPLPLLDEMTSLASLEDLPALADAILAGQVRGRVVIDPNR